MRSAFRSRPVQGEFVRYDGRNAAEIAAFAGDQYEGTDEDGRPLVRGPDGDLCALLPGWAVNRADGTGRAGVASASAWGIWAEELT